MPIAQMRLSAMYCHLPKVDKSINCVFNWCVPHRLVTDARGCKGVSGMIADAQNFN